MCAYREVRAGCPVPSSIPLSLSLSLNGKLVLGYTSGQGALGIHCLCPARAGLQRGTAITEFLHRCWRFKLRSLCAQCRYSYLLNNPLVPTNQFSYSGPCTCFLVQFDPFLGQDDQGYTKFQHTLAALVLENQNCF